MGHFHISHSKHWHAPGLFRYLKLKATLLSILTRLKKGYRCSESCFYLSENYILTFNIQASWITRKQRWAARSSEPGYCAHASPYPKSPHAMTQSIASLTQKISQSPKRYTPISKASRIRPESFQFWKSGKQSCRIGKVLWRFVHILSTFGHIWHVFSSPSMRPCCVRTWQSFIKLTMSMYWKR